MSRPTFGVDIECPRCGEIHPASEDCRDRELSDRVWLHRANNWRHGQPGGTEFTSDSMCKAIKRPYNDKLIGALIGEWQKMGYIREVRITTTTRKARHHGTLRVWRIL